MNRRNSGNGGIFPLLALVLLFVTVFGFFGQMDPTREMKRAYEKTVEILSEEEEEIRFLRQCLMQGKTTLSLGKETVTYQADLPRAASLSFAGKGYGAALTSHGDRLILSSEELLSENRAAKRQDAVSEFWTGAFVESECLSEETRMLVGLYLALTDPSFLEAGDLFENTAEDLLEIASPDCKKEKNTLTVGEEELSVKDISYLFSSEDLKKMWTLFSAEAKKEGFLEAVVSAYACLCATEEKAVSEEKREAIRDFLNGEGKTHKAFAEVFLSAESEGKLSFHLYKGKVIGIGFSLKSGDVKANGEILFGNPVEGASMRSLSLSVKKEDETVFSLALSAAIREDSETAFVREWNVAVTDTKNFLLTDKTESQGKIRFSWGRVKKDIGLRLVLDEKEIALGGQLKEYKEGKTCEFSLSRLEVDRENRLQGKTLTVTLSPSADGISVPKAEQPLFPEGEEKKALAEDFKTRYEESVK